MIPDKNTCYQLWEKYNLPEYKKNHCQIICDLAEFIAGKISKNKPEIKINTALLTAGALLHDIDKNIPKLEGESHPDAGVRILNQEGMEEVASLINTHPVHMVLDSKTPPIAIEEKILFLADKMVKHSVVGVDGRFDLWSKEELPEKQKEMLKKVYPSVKQLEKEISILGGVDLSKIAL